MTSRMRRPSVLSSEALLSGAGAHPSRSSTARGHSSRRRDRSFNSQAHVLVGQGEEVAHGVGAGLAHGLEQPLHHGAEELVGLQVQRGLRQAGIAPIQEVGAEPLQATDGAVQERPDDRIGGPIPPQRIEVALHGR